MDLGLFFQPIIFDSTYEKREGLGITSGLLFRNRGPADQTRSRTRPHGPLPEPQSFLCRRWRFGAIFQ